MREYNVGAVYINDNVYAGETNIPLLKGNQGYSISRVAKTSGTGTPGSYDTYTIYINTNPESIVGTFQVWNGTGNIGDMTKAEYDTDNDGIVDNAERVNNHTVDIDVPSNAKFTDTIYDDTAITNRVTTLENAGYITKSVSDLVNYYTKTETYTKAEVNALVDTIPKFAIEVVNSLPTHDISTTTIYLVRDDSQTGDIYQEYIYVNNTWELLGAQRIDLSNYYTKSETYAKTETYNKTEVDNAIAGIEGNEVIITDDPTELDDQKIWVDTSSNATYINQEVQIGATNPSNTPLWITQSKNLFDGTSNGKVGYYLDSNGVETSGGENLRISNYIRINASEGNITVSGMENTMNAPSICFYDKTKTFISGVSYGALATKTIEIPSTAYYFRTSFRTTNPNTMIEYGTTASTYTPYVMQKIIADGEEIYDRNTLYGTTLYENSNGTHDNFTLSEAITNFSKVEIIFAHSNWTGFKVNSVVSVASSGSTYTPLMLEYAGTDGSTITKGCAIWALNGTTATKSRMSCGTLSSTGYAQNTSHYINVYKVIGYK